LGGGDADRLAAGRAAAAGDHGRRAAFRGGGCAGGGAHARAAGGPGGDPRDPVATPSQVYEVTLVFRDGLGYDSAALRQFARGKVGIF
jgi:hypothetical protein